MARKGSLSRKTYFPIVGDTFVISHEKAECVRSNTYNAVRYGLIEKENGAFLSVHSEDTEWLDSVAQITRKGKLYTFNLETDTWQES